ncbi:hypothetical protein [Owenweeksia hongkongensis]|uniref:Uncharacterized protein n=2 Tax=Owenweeksia TaxID=267986 RepID=G8R079_OWEHD|nr:hypothetical protein [Owenweeksia hongkongensis]AEV33745.1 hypothetical protein Oweho_2783 [Owenweeksia hongkongensis DSM 17368]
MLSALIFLTVMANRPLPDIPWFALSEINEINEINEQHHAKWLNLNLDLSNDVSQINSGKPLSSVFTDESLLPLSWVEMVQTPPPELS